MKLCCSIYDIKCFKLWSSLHYDDSSVTLRNTRMETEKCFLLILFPEANSGRSFCDTTDRRNVLMNLIWAAPSQVDAVNNEGKTYIQPGNMCSCNITGIFKLRVKDVRLYGFEYDSCPSIIVKGCRDNNCNTVESNCTHTVSLNRWVSQNVVTGYISLTGLSSLFSPSLVWIQILHRGE